MIYAVKYTHMYMYVNTHRKGLENAADFIIFQILQKDIHFQDQKDK